MKYLVPIKLPSSYLKKWNAEMYTDFVTFANDPKSIIVEKDKDVKNYALFRVGGLSNLDNYKYINLIHYKENFYPDSITKDSKRKPYLASIDVVVDLDGNVVLESDSFIHSIYLFGVVAKIENSYYYNLELKKKYDYYYSMVESVKHVILHGYDKPALVINKITGEETIIE